MALGGNGFGSRSIVMRTVFGQVEVPSPRLLTCRCGAKKGEPRRFVSPLCKAVSQRVTPELEYLQAKWAAHLPYRQATELGCQIPHGGGGLAPGLGQGDSVLRVPARGAPGDLHDQCH